METRPPPDAIRLLTYLSPGLPLDLFGAVADHLRRCPGLGGRGRVYGRPLASTPAGSPSA